MSEITLENAVEIAKAHAILGPDRHLVYSLELHDLVAALVARVEALERLSNDCDALQSLWQKEFTRQAKQRDAAMAMLSRALQPEGRPHIEDLVMTTLTTLGADVAKETI